MEISSKIKASGITVSLAVEVSDDAYQLLDIDSQGGCIDPDLGRLSENLGFQLNQLLCSSYKELHTCFLRHTCETLSEDFEISKNS